MGFDRDGYDRDGFNRYGFDDHLVHHPKEVSFMSCNPGVLAEYHKRLVKSMREHERRIECLDNLELTGELFDRNGFDLDGYDRNGFDRNGFDREGFDREGYDRHGFDRNGLNRFGLDEYGYKP